MEEAYNFVQTIKMTDLDVHKVYNILQQNQADVDEAISATKFVKQVANTFALCVEKPRSRRRKKNVVYSSELDEERDNDETQKQIERGLTLLTKAFQKKFYSKPTNKG